MSKRYDVVIVGAGVLGSCIAYWISSTCKASVCVIDKEMLPAEHASSRNTGIVHSPFYLDPKKKSKIAKASFNSHGSLFSDAIRIAHLAVGRIKRGFG